MKTIKLNFGKSNEISYEDYKQLNSFDEFSSKVSQSQLIMRLTEAQLNEAIEALEDGDSVEVV